MAMTWKKLQKRFFNSILIFFYFINLIEAKFIKDWVVGGSNFEDATKS